MKKIVLITILSVLRLFAQTDAADSTAYSQDKDTIYDSRIHLTLGWFIPYITTSAQLNSSTGRTGATINLESTFNLPTTKQLFRFEGLYRFNNTSSVDFYYYLLNRSGSNIATDSLNFGNIVIPVDASLESHFNMSLFGSRYYYSFVNNQNFEAGLSAGLSFLNIDMGALVTLNNKTAEETYKDLLFLPVIGFYNRFKLGERFTFRDRVNLFALDIDRYNGILIDLSFSLEYLIFKNLAAGAAFSVFTLDVTFDAKKSGRIQYGQRGISLFASFKL
jgi:hypothetical protein